ncbi:MAG: OmpA family protein [Ruminococcus sp.]|nr:OmpA family protein [Ruminococcus sp.]
MDIMKKALAVVVSAAMAAGLSGCAAKDVLWGEAPQTEYSEDEGTSDTIETDEEETEAAEEAAGAAQENDTDSEDAADSHAISDIDPDAAEVYVADAGAALAETEYTSECLYGRYTADTEKLNNQAMISSYSGSFDDPAGGMTLIALPYKFEAGPHSNVTTLNYVPGHNWVNLYLVDAAGADHTLQASYEVKDGKLLVQPVAYSSYDSDTKQLDYALSDTILEYGIAFSGTSIELSYNDESITLYASDILSGSGVSLSDSSLKADSEPLAGIEKLNISGGTGTVTADGTEYPCSASFSSDGLATLMWSDKIVQAAYFCCGSDGIIFTDGSKNYVYTAKSWDLYASGVTANLAAGDEDKLSEMTEEEITAIANRSDQLYDDLNAAFEQAGINAQINKETGEIALDSVVLFDLGKSDVSDEGKEFINKFMQAYTSVIFSDEYKGFISQIMVEGHTDQNGGYDYNMELSKARADSVRSYCLSSDTGLSHEYTERLNGLLTSVGYSYDVPVLNDDGSVNNSASRRVSFRFLINIDQ